MYENYDHMMCYGLGQADGQKNRQMKKLTHRGGCSTYHITKSSVEVRCSWISVVNLQKDLEGLGNL